MKTQWMVAAMKPEILVIGMTLDLGCQVNDWTRKAFSSKNFADSNVRSGHLFTVSARRNEIDELLSSEENVHLVTEKLLGFLAAVEMFKEAHLAYSSNLEDEVSVARCQEQFNAESSRANLFYQRVQEWIKRSEECARLNSQVNPEDSTSQIGSRATSKSSSRKSRRSSHSGSNKSNTLAFARAKEAARIAELEAEAAVLEKRRSLEEQKLCIQQEQERLTLETELAKSKAKEQVLSLIMEGAPRSFVQSNKLESQ